MKLVVVGLGQCGGRIADEFARMNNKAKSRRGMTIVTGCFAVNTDAAWQPMLARVSMSACIPAPPVLSDPAKVMTTGGNSCSLIGPPPPG